MVFSLKKGDKVGIISPSSSLEKEDIASAVKYLESLGLEIVFGKNVFKKHRWMAGTERERANDISDMHKNKDIKAIFCSAGGVGSQKILPYIDYDLIRNNPKPIFGFSDNTSLQLAVYALSKQISYTGFSLKYDFRNSHIDSLVEDSLKKVISGKKQTIKSGKTVIKGKTKAVMIGGCLSMVRNLAGTKYLPNLKDKILLLEDVDEKTYKIDLMLEQIKQLKNFDKVKGIVFGKFEDCIITEKENSSIDEVISEFCKGLNIPVIKDFEYSHSKSRYVLPMGKKVTLDADNCILEA